MYARVTVNLRRVAEELALHPDLCGRVNIQQVSEVLSVLGQHTRDLSAAEGLALLNAIIERAGQVERSVAALKRVG